ncbi:WD40-repeat-containing domain protein [Mycena olivaceomarginata]|nr:WD40-repeat-containing domain protein [Mycena olivaceomarginata]
MDSIDGEDHHSPTVSSFSSVDARHLSFYRDDEGRTFNDLLHDLKLSLEIFASSVRQLGSSLGLYKGSRQFQQQLSSVRLLLEDESQVELLVHGTLKTSGYPAETWVHGDLKRLVNSLALFSTAWDDYPEFIDNDRRHYLVALEQNLLVWLNILGCYENSPELLRCVRELLFDTVLELDHVTRRLADFIETGVQEISFAQKHSTQILWNTATIATFFSAVTVTTIQYSYMNVQSRLEISVNTLWFSSLVLSVSSAINSLLAMTWRQAIYSTPQRRVPWWVRVWFKQTPIILLSISVLSFLAGLLCFVYLSQNQFTKIVVSALTAIVAIGLGAISVWFAWERWDFSRLRRKLWLHEEHENTESGWQMLVYDYIVGIIWRSASTALPTRSPLRRHRMPIQTPGSFVLRHQSFVGQLDTSGNPHERVPRGGNDRALLNIPTPTAAYSDAVFPEFALQWTVSLGRSEHVFRHVQFSSKGTWLAACTKSICYIYQVKPQITVHQALKHPFGQIRQLEWSPDEKHLLIRVSGGIELWEVKENNLENRQKEWMGNIIRKVQWINNKSFLVSMEDGLIQFKIRDNGHLSPERTIPFETGLYTFAVVPPGDCVLVVAGHRSRVHEDIRFPKRTVRSVMNYNLRTGKLLYSFPLLHDVRWINVSSDGNHVILGFSNQQTPELWSSEGHDDDSSARICFKHRFTTSSGKDRFRGPPHFVGSRDEFVACVTSVDSIQIWDRDENRIIGSLPMSSRPNQHSERRAAAIPVLTWHPGQAMFASAVAETLNVWVPGVQGRIRS